MIVRLTVRTRKRISPSMAWSRLLRTAEPSRRLSIEKSVSTCQRWP
ncbi:MAG: hypothetical protein WBD05_03680 [Phycisphaerae bacterium]